MSALLKALYWAIAGGLLGVGIIAILSIGIFLVVASVPLIVIGVLRGWVREWWAGIVGFGLAPMLILLANLQGADAIQPASTAETYQIMAIVFGAIAALGLLVGIGVETYAAVRVTRVSK